MYPKWDFGNEHCLTPCSVPFVYPPCELDLGQKTGLEPRVQTSYSQMDV